MKCNWCEDDGLLEPYHDTEWGISCHSDKMLNEYLTLECMSARLSWMLMLRKREIFRACFAEFDYKTDAAFAEGGINKAME